MPTPHQVSRTVGRKTCGRLPGDVIHFLGRFADAQTADGVSFEPNGHGRLDALSSEIGKDTALDDTELRLAGVRHTLAGSGAELEEAFA